MKTQLTLVSKNAAVQVLERQVVQHLDDSPDLWLDAQSRDADAEDLYRSVVRHQCESRLHIRIASKVPSVSTAI